MPEKLAYRTGIALTLFFYHALPSFRRLAQRHLEIAFGNEKSPAEIQAILRQTYVNYGKNLVEFLILPQRKREWVEKKVLLSDPNWYMRTQLATGKGSVSLGAHFGSWELVGARLGIYRYPLVVIVRAQRDAIFSRFMMETRTQWGNEYVFKTRGIKEECFRQLAMNKIVGLIADQNATRGGVFVNFFGKPASTVTGPAEIAIRAGVPILPGFPARNPDDTITLYAMPPIIPANTGNFEEDVRATMQMCMDSVEAFAREHPAEYFWWHKRWHTRPPEEIQKRNEEEK